MEYTKWSWLVSGILGLFILITASSGSRVVPFGRVGSDLGDYRLQNGEPFVTLFEHENYRGRLNSSSICVNLNATLTSYSRFRKDI